MEELVAMDVTGGRLLGGLVSPASPVAQAWLVCQPIFEERKSSLRPLVELSRDLAAAGVATLRVDYRGCGDSSGEFDAFSLADWHQDALTALAWLAKRFPAAKLGVFGLRFGAAIAIQALKSSSQHAVASMLLWEPVIVGADYLSAELRKKLMKEMLTFGGNRTTREALIEQLQGGESVDVDGYRLVPRLFQDIRAVNLLADAESLRLERSLIVGIGASEKLSPGLATLATVLARHSTVATRAVRMPQFWNQIGVIDCRGLIEQTVALAECRTSRPSS